MLKTLLKYIFNFIFYCLGFKDIKIVENHNANLEHFVFFKIRFQLAVPNQTQI